jgi:hypothetical protein
VIEIARFADVYEAEIVASRLRADGFSPTLGGAEHAKVNFLVLQALGGVSLSVPDSQADAARVLLEALRGGLERIEDADPVLPKSARKAGLVAVLTIIGLGFLVGR